MKLQAAIIIVDKFLTDTRRGVATTPRLPTDTLSALEQVLEAATFLQDLREMVCPEQQADTRSAPDAVQASPNTERGNG